MNDFLKKIKLGGLPLKDGYSGVFRDGLSKSPPKPSYAIEQELKVGRNRGMSTDGVGSKAMLAARYGMYDGIGIDLVAMCVNDLVCNGFYPEYFTDYISFNKIDEEVFEKIINSIQKGCDEAGCELIAGETAETPGLYQENYFDLAGTAYGSTYELYPHATIKEGDCLVGLASSGLHANGFTLVRQVIEENKIDLDKEKIDGELVIEKLMTPTTIYVKPILKLIEKGIIKGCAHITGGGVNNINRILPEGLEAVFSRTPYNWKRHLGDEDLFSWLALKSGRADIYEQISKKLNCGYGMILVVSIDNLRSGFANLKNIQHELLGTVRKKKHAV